MRMGFRAWSIWTVGALGCALLGCAAGAPTPEGRTDGGADAGECVYDEDCASPQLFQCNQSTSRCEPSCRLKADCSAQVRGQYALPECGGALGCECDEFRCVPSACSDDSDCGSQVCRNAACVAPPTDAVARCQVVPDFVVLNTGASARFTALAWDAAGKPVVLKAVGQWAAVAGGPMARGEGPHSGVSAEFTAASATSGTEPSPAVEVAFGAVKCQAKAIAVLSAVEASAVGAVVVDELTGRPVEGAELLASKADGSVISQPGGVAVKTDARGYGKLSISGITGAYSVSAFHPDYSYLTIANYSGSTRLLSMVIRRNQGDKYGGYQGSFGSSVPVSPNIHLSFAGLSLPGIITSLSARQVLGASVPTDVKIGTVVDEKGVGIPAGVFLGFGEQPIKSPFSAQGLAGICRDEQGAFDEASIRAGTCGTGTAWALTADVALRDLPLEAISGESVDVNAFLERMLPLLRGFSSSVVRDVKYTLKETPLADGGFDSSDEAHFAKVAHTFNQVRLAFVSVAKLPELPKIRGQYADGVIVLGGARVPGQGLVPLGLGLGVNVEPYDGKTDKQANLASQGMVQVRMAPTHHGIEGSEYALMVAALSSKDSDSSAAGTGGAALYARLPGNRLSFDPEGAKPLDLSTTSFPALPERARFNFSDSAQASIPARSFRFAQPQTLPGLGVLRVVFEDDFGRRWEVLADPAKGAQGFTLPHVPGALSDRLFAHGLSSGERSKLAVQGLSLVRNPRGEAAPIAFNDYVELGGANAERTMEMLTGLSYLDYSRPGVNFKDVGAVLGKGAKVKVQVSSFKVGTQNLDDGVVRLTFRSMEGMQVAGCPALVVKTETTAGKGELEQALPATCLGASLSMTAELLQTDEASPLDPAVGSTMTVTIQ